MTSLEEGVRRVRALFSLWKDCRAGGDDFNLHETVKELLVELRAVQGIADELLSGPLEALGRSARSALEAQEVEARRSNIRAVKAMLADIKGKVESPDSARAELFAGGGSNGGRARGGGAAAAAGARQGMHDAAESGDGAVQAMMVAEQDEVLEDISVMLGRLKHKGELIQTELRHQDVLITGLMTDVDHTQSRLDRVTAQINVLLKNKDKGKFCTIFSLVIILLILFYIALFG